MKNRSGLLLAVVFVFFAGGCTTLQENAGKIGGAVVGGVAMHALTGGASTAWHAIGTAVGVGGGVYVGDKLDKK